MYGNFDKPITMKLTTKHIFRWLGLTMLIGILLSGCQRETPFGENYDVDFPLPTISSIEPATVEVGQQVTIKGSNLDRVIELEVGQTRRVIKNEDIVSKSATEVVIQVPRLAEAGPITVKTNLAKSATSPDILSPTYLEAEVTQWPSVIYRGQMFKVQGNNMDMVTSALVGSERVALEGGAAMINSLSISTEGMDLSNVTELVIVLDGRAGVVNGSSPAIPVEDYSPVTCYEPDSSIVFFDFEDGADPYSSAGTAGIDVTSAVASSGVSKGRSSNFFSLVGTIESGKNWDAMGNLLLTQAVDVSEMTNPHLTFMVNTNGGQGYFQVEMEQDGVGSGGHFTNSLSGDDYSFATQGWEWRSVALADLNQSTGGWGDGVDPSGAPIQINFGFKQGNGGNAGTNFELYLDQIMITDGKYAPAGAGLDFEDGADIYSGSASSTVNGLGLPTIMGDFYQTVQISDGSTVAKWNWTGDVGTYTPIDLSEVECPYVNVWVNTGSGKGYFQIETFQGSTKFGVPQTAPDYYFETNGEWQLVSIALIDENMQKWSGDEDFDSGGVLDYVKIGFSTGNVENEPYIISVDNLFVSDGPLF